MLDMYHTFFFKAKHHIDNVWFNWVLCVTGIPCDWYDNIWIQIKIMWFPFQLNLYITKKIESKKNDGVREARTLDLRITQTSYETYALANCATTPL
jgi:hypothetical protein